MGEVRCLLLYLNESLFSVLTLERQSLGDHAVQDDSNGPQVNLLAVADLVEDFGGNIRGCPAALQRHHCRGGQLGQPEVGHLNGL